VGELSGGVKAGNGQSAADNVYHNSDKQFVPSRRKIMERRRFGWRR
jgi:hypothetical protein